MFIVAFMMTFRIFAIMVFYFGVFFGTLGEFESIEELSKVNFIKIFQKHSSVYLPKRYIVKMNRTFKISKLLNALQINRSSFCAFIFANNF